ncbi:MAG: hypothetical protein PHY82_11500, partial [Lentisphaeria bacterium]|nr:hypothetical protein [Lentisphaeria bacterium]
CFQLMLFHGVALLMREYSIERRPYQVKYGRKFWPLFNKNGYNILSTEACRIGTRVVDCLRFLIKNSYWGNRG